MGIKLFDKEASLFFKKKYVHQAEEFYKRHGNRMIIFARFVPIIRTFAPIVAGIGKMRYKTFMLYNMLSGIIWANLIILGGYSIGGIIPGASHYILPIAFFIIILSLSPLIYKFAKKAFK